MLQIKIIDDYAKHQSKVSEGCYLTKSELGKQDTGGSVAVHGVLPLKGLLQILAGLGHGRSCHGALGPWIRTEG